MHHTQLVEHIRQLVKDTLTEQGVRQLDELCETILIRDGFYCGRCFTCGEFRAVWFLEENVIKFFCRKSGLVFTCSAGPSESAPRALVA
jgi:hypothetical protein